MTGKKKFRRLPHGAEQESTESRRQGRDCSKNRERARGSSGQTESISRLGKGSFLVLGKKPETLLGAKTKSKIWISDSWRVGGADFPVSWGWR